MAASVYKPSGKRNTQLRKTKPPLSTAKSAISKGAVGKSSPSTVATGKRLQSSRTRAANSKPPPKDSLSTVHASEPAQKSQPQEWLTAGSLSSVVKKSNIDSTQEQQSDVFLQDEEQKRSRSKKAAADGEATRTAARACAVRTRVPWRDVHVDRRAERREESGFNIKQHGFVYAITHTNFISNPRLFFHLHLRAFTSQFDCIDYVIKACTSTFFL